jgi:hypothetical protein
MAVPLTITFKVLTGTYALDDGNIEIEGHADDGPTVIKIPGEHVRTLITSLTSLLPRVRAASPEGQRVVFQLTDLQVMTTHESPDHVELNLKAYPNQLFAFSLPISELERMAEHLQRAATQAREAEARGGRKPQ